MRNDTPIDVVNMLPDGFLRAALMGVCRHFHKIGTVPIDMKYGNTYALFITRVSETRIPKDAIIMTDRDHTDSFEKEYNVKRIYTEMTDEEKQRALGQ